MAVDLSEDICVGVRTASCVALKHASCVVVSMLVAAADMADNCCGESA